MDTNLEYLSRQSEAAGMFFIGGTCLRLVHGINRFSEDLDFDCINLDQTKFMRLTDNLAVYLEKCGYKVEVKDKESDKLTAFHTTNIMLIVRCNYMPGFEFALWVA
jgi:predicted nucleotidyltransferase component of viral defense system